MNPKIAHTAFLVVLVVLLASLVVLPVAGAGVAPTGPKPVDLKTGSGPPNGQWSTFKNRADRTGRTRLVGPQTGNLKWQHLLNSIGIQSAPVIARDGTVYIGSVEGALYAFRPDGTIRWRRDLSIYQITSSPALGRDGTIYIVPENGDLHALNPNGALQWAFNMEGYGGPSASPVVGGDGVIYVGADYFYAVYPDGTLKWRVDTGSYMSGPAGIGTDGAIYFPSQNTLFALNPDGTQKWRFAGQSAYPLGSAPAIGLDGMIYINTNDGVLHAVRPDGALKWKYETEGIVMDVPSSPAIGFDGTIYFGGGGEYGGEGGYFYALNPDGTLKWKFHAGCDQTAPSIGGDGTIYFGSNSCGTLYALRPDGVMKWSYSDSLMYMRSVPAIGLGQRLYVGTLGFLTEGGLLAFGP